MPSLFAHLHRASLLHLNANVPSPRFCSSVIPENYHHPHLPAQPGDHVGHSTASLVLHGGHEQRPRGAQRWWPQHRLALLRGIDRSPSLVRIELDIIPKCDVQFRRKALFLSIENGFMDECCESQICFLSKISRHLTSVSAPHTPYQKHCFSV